MGLKRAEPPGPRADDGWKFKGDGVRAERRRRRKTKESDILVYVTQCPGLYTLLRRLAEEECLGPGRTPSVNATVLRILKEQVVKKVGPLPSRDELIFDDDGEHA